VTAHPAFAVPEAERVALGFLRANLTGTRVLTDLPSDLTGKTVQVTRIGGAGDGFRIDQARLDIDCYAPTRAEAAALAGQVRSLLSTMRNQTHSGAVVVAVVEEIGPSWRPDFNPNVRRFGLTVLLVLRPA
jgi:hypothetical protein